MSEPATNMCVAALAIGFENPDRVRQRLWNGMAVDMAGNRAIGRVSPPIYKCVAQNGDSYCKHNECGEQNHAEDDQWRPKSFCRHNFLVKMKLDITLQCEFTKINVI